MSFSGTGATDPVYMIRHFKDPERYPDPRTTVIQARCLKAVKKEVIETWGGSGASLKTWARYLADGSELGVVELAPNHVGLDTIAAPTYGHWTIPAAFGAPGWNQWIRLDSVATRQYVLGFYGLALYGLLNAAPAAQEIKGIRFRDAETTLMAIYFDELETLNDQMAIAFEQEIIYPAESTITVELKLAAAVVNPQYLQLLGYKGARGSIILPEVGQ